MEFISLPGLTRFKDAHELMLVWSQARAGDEIEDRSLFLEHHPVITRGRGLQFRSGEDPQTREKSKPLLVSVPVGVDYSECERGGDLTWHGPGQLIWYPIIKIRDIEAYIRALEQTVIDALQSLYGIAGFRIKDSSGVWVKDANQQDRKIASVGIAVKKWVTLHGIAINVTNDPAGFSLISPCGYTPETMIRVVDLKPEVADTDWRTALEHALAHHSVNALTSTLDQKQAMPTPAI